MVGKQEKADHVRRARRDPDHGRHHCHYPGCTKTCPPAAYMCLPHWRSLPKRFQAAVWAHYRIGQEVDKRPTREYVSLHREIENFCIIRDSGL